MENLELPKEIQDLYNTLYKKIEWIVAGDDIIDLRSDPTTFRVLIESAMTIVENFRNENGQGWNGPEKKRYALTLIKFVLNDLAAKGKLDKDIAKEFVANIDFWGGIVMDVAIDAIKEIFYVGQDFVQEVQKKGCKKACSRYCCFIK